MNSGIINKIIVVGHNIKKIVYKSIAGLDKEEAINRNTIGSYNGCEQKDGEDKKD